MKFLISTVKGPVLFIMPYAPLNNRSLAPVQAKITTVAGDAQWTITGLYLLAIMTNIAFSARFQLS